MSTDYRRSHLSPDYGRLYDAQFSDNPHREMVWQLEKSILDRIVATFYRDSEIRYLDFACGTGRILSYLENRASRAVGVDVSPSMLAVARRNSRNAEIYEADLTRGDVLGDCRFNLITAFRFFPNAEADLREEAMHVLVRRLEDNGCLVFNNHMNTGSTRFRLARLLGRGGDKGMSIAEVKALLAENHLEIVKVYHLCVLPASEEHMFLPQPLLRCMEGFLSRIPVLRSFGEDLVFVCKHAHSGQAAIPTRQVAACVDEQLTDDSRWMARGEAAGYGRSIRTIRRDRLDQAWTRRRSGTASTEPA